MASHNLLLKLSAPTTLNRFQFWNSQCSRKKISIHEIPSRELASDWLLLVRLLTENPAKVICLSAVDPYRFWNFVVGRTHWDSCWFSDWHYIIGKLRRADIPAFDQFFSLVGHKRKKFSTQKALFSRIFQVKIEQKTHVFLQRYIFSWKRDHDAESWHCFQLMKLISLWEKVIQ